MSLENKIKVGSRKSELALIQTKHVISLLTQYHPNKDFEIVTMSTLGDQILDIPLPKIGEKSLFTKELETALAQEEVDFIVHSLKDLPTCLPRGMAIGAVLTRETPHDALVLQKDLKDYTLATLPKGSVIGTSSLRRTAQIGKKYPHLNVENIRGNLNTRLKKLDDLGKYQAIILASAGLKRIGWSNRISKTLSTDEFLYAVGQGAIAVECRDNDQTTIKLLEPLYDLQTALRVVSERSFLKTLGGGCSAPVAVMSDLKLVKEKEVEMYLKGAVWSLDGKEEVQEQENANISVLNGIRCAECPYVNGEKILDIECCVVCPSSPTKEPNAKKQKLDIPAEILNNDPHEKCPVPLPVGAEFMGQCPYLEENIGALHNNISLNGSVGQINSDMTKCPFLKSQSAEHSLQYNKLEIPSSQTAQTVENDSLFTGLVSHKDISRDDMQKAVILGETLAQKLISKGALQIMAKAQAVIHGKQSEVSVSS